MKRKVGFYYFLPSAVYALIVGVLVGIFAALGSDNFTAFLMAFIVIGLAALAAALSLIGMLLLDFLGKPSRYGYLFFAISNGLIAASGIMLFVIPFEEASSWKNIFLFLALIGGTLGLTYAFRSAFSFLMFQQREEFASRFQERIREEEKSDPATSLDPGQVIEVDAVDVEEKKE